MPIIKDEKYLNLSFVPDKLLFRENEISKIRTALIEPLVGGISGTVILYGEPGTGKTTTAKHISRTTADLDCVYMNALSFPSLTALLREVVSTFTRLDQFSTYTISDLLRSISKIQERRGKGILLIIDESTNLMREDQAGLYSIMRASEIYSLRLSSILISLDDPYIIFRKKRTRSVSSYVPIKFSRYTKDELYMIIEDRAGRGLYPATYDDQIITMIADIAAQLGSARVAIELLQKAAYIAKHDQSESISPDDIRAARAMINPYFTESKLNGLEHEDLVLLLSTAFCLKDGLYATLSNVMARYAVLAESYGMQPMDRQKFYRVASRLETYGLLESRLEGRGDRKGVEKVLMINDVPLDALSEKIESILARLP